MLSVIREKISAYVPSKILCPVDIRSSVVVPIFEEGRGEMILLTKRTLLVKAHPGEISFPGGMYEESDLDTRNTALRECSEEIGVRAGDVDIIGRLDDERTLSGFIITPYVGAIPYPYQFTVNPQEVAYLIFLPMSYLLEAVPEIETARHGDATDQVPAIYYEGERIWGATCRILLKFRKIIQNGEV